MLYYSVEHYICASVENNFLSMPQGRFTFLDIELNEAFAAQSLAVIRKLGIDQNKLNLNGGAIALGHPLGCSGAKLSIQLFDEMRTRNQKYGMVTACVGGGQGVAGIYERLN